MTLENPPLHVAQITQPLHKVFFILGTTRAFGGILEILEPGGLAVGFGGKDFAAKSPEPGEEFRIDRGVSNHPAGE